MPYYLFYDQIEEDDDAGKFTYEAQEATFDFANGPEFMRRIRDAFVSRGFDEVQIRYDGGNDEGFSYFDYAVANGVRFSVDELVELLQKTAIMSAIDVLYEDDRNAASYREQMRNRIHKMIPPDRVKELLEEFGNVLATALLGAGYGTGEYELRGQFRADLKTGRLTDVEGGEED